MKNNLLEKYLMKFGVEIYPGIGNRVGAEDSVETVLDIMWFFFLPANSRYFYLFHKSAKETF